MTDMRIVRLVSGFPPDPSHIHGKMESHVWNLSREQVRQGHEVTVLALAPSPVVPEPREVDGVRLCWVSRPSVVRWQGGVTFARAIRELVGHPDIVHGFSAAPFGWLFPRMRKMLPEARFVLSVYTTLFPFRFQNVSGLRQRIDLFEFEQLMRFLLRFVDAVTPVSPMLAHELRTCGFPSERVFPVPNGWSRLEFYPKKTESIAWTQAMQKGLEGTESARTEPFLVLYVGRLAPKKGVPVLLDALERLLASPDLLPAAGVRLALVGGSISDYGSLAVLPRLVDGSLQGLVRLEDALPRKELAELLRSADLFVLPSLSAERPKALLQAMASGLPVIASRVHGISELVHDGENGLLVPPGNPVALAAAIGELLRDSYRRALFGHQAVLTAEKYEWGNVARMCTEAFEQILRLPKRR